MPAVDSRSFLITIGDRTVVGMTVRDQMVGPWQTLVADGGRHSRFAEHWRQDQGRLFDART